MRSMSLGHMSEKRKEENVDVKVFGGANTMDI
jgi:hypothetical protein